MDTIIAGFDPVAVDSVGCRVIGLDPQEVRHIRLAYERKMGRMLPEEIEVMGRSVESVLCPLKTEIPEAAEVHENITVIEGKDAADARSPTAWPSLSTRPKMQIAWAGSPWWSGIRVPRTTGGRPVLFRRKLRHPIE